MRIRASRASLLLRLVLLSAIVAFGVSSLVREPRVLRLTLAALAGLALGCQFQFFPGWRARLAATIVGVCLTGALLVGDGGGAFRAVSSWSGRWEVLERAVRIVTAGAFPTTISAGKLIVEICLIAIVAGVVAIAVRRPFAAAAAALVVNAYCWTLGGTRYPLLSGVIVVVALVLAVGDRVRWTLRAGAAIGLAGVSLALAVPFASSQPLISWRAWQLGGVGPRDSAVISFAQDYGQLSWPEKPAILARTKSPQALPLRAGVLPVFADGRFVSDPNSERTPLVVQEQRIVLEADEFGEVDQQIIYEGAASQVLLTAGQPSSVFGPFRGATASRRDESVQVTPGVPSGARYRVRTRVIDPGAVALATGLALDDPPTDLAIEPGATVQIPTWTPGIAPVPAEQFGVYAPVARLAHQLSKGAKNQYEVVVRTEAFLRTPTNFRYDERPSLPPAGVPTLVDFVQTSRVGFCQQFAGTMALMLRMNGIPARVAVGFNLDRNRYNNATGEYTVVDRDAHSWVEVRFPAYGWLPFDPTPGRSAPNRASSSTLAYSLSGLSLPSFGAPLPAAPIRPAAGPAPSPSTPPTPPAPSAAPQTSGPLLWPFVLALSAFCLIGGVAAAKALRRHRRRSTGNANTRVIAAGRELHDLLRDLSLPTAPGATGGALARSLLVETGIGAEGFYRTLGAARFGGRTLSEEAAAVAWSAHDAIRDKLRAGSSRPRWLTSLITPRSLRPPSLP